MSRRAWAWCAGTLVVLVLVTALATVALMDVNRNVYESLINQDPQGNDQQWEALRVSAALMYTSGHSVGQLCAAPFGVLLAAVTEGRARRLSMVVAVLGGIVLAAVSLAVALPRAAAEVGSLWMIDELVRHGSSIDPDLLHDRGVLAFLVAGLVAFPVWALIGLGAGLGRHPLKAAAFGLAWYPVSVALGFVTFGLTGAVLPFYSNVGTAVLVVRWPATAPVVMLVMALWAAGQCLNGFAARIAKARAASQNGR